MTTLQTSVHGAYGNDELAQAVARGEKFTAGGRAYGQANVRGEGSPDYVERGKLNDAGRDALASSEKASMEYVIYSYSTPIAWKAGGVWHMVSQKFSPSTTRHQGMVRGILHNLGVADSDIKYV